MRKLLVYITLVFLFTDCYAQKGIQESDKGWSQLKIVLSKIKAPQFPKRDFIITNYGAKGDSITDCTPAFRNAIEACNKAGGGRVVVPAGVFLTGAIHLKSNVNLYLSEKSRILFSTDPAHYLPVVYNRFEGVECYNYSPFIYAYEQENIAITGKGTLDGQAGDANWWSWKGSKENTPTNQRDDVNALNKMGEDNVPVAQRIFGARHYLRPNFIQPNKCKNILIDGIKIVRSPMWEIHPVLSENITVQNVSIYSHGPNNDGCDPESCKNVLIKNCIFDTGDDCIAIKSGRNNDGRRVNVASENIVIQNCQMKDGHGGVVIGSEISGSCRNVFAENCTMDSPNLDRALRIKTNSVRGGIVENVYMRNIKVGQVKEAVILVSFQYQEGDAGKFTPVVRNINVSNVTSKSSDYAIFFDAYERSPVTTVNISNCKFDGVKKGNFLRNFKDIHLDNVSINGKPVTELR